MRKILLLLSIVFVVFCYAYPCFVLPFGAYKYETTYGGVKVETTYQFKFNGKVKIKSGELEHELYYKVKGNELILSEDKEFTEDDSKVEMASMYKIGEAVNAIGQYTAIGVGVLSLLLVITIPKKK